MHAEDWSFHLCHKTFGMAFICGVQRELVLWHQQQGVFESGQHFAVKWLWTSLPEAVQESKAEANAPPCIMPLHIPKIVAGRFVIYIKSSLGGSRAWYATACVLWLLHNARDVHLYSDHDKHMSPEKRCGPPHLHALSGLNFASAVGAGVCLPRLPLLHAPPPAERQRCCRSCQTLAAAN